MSTYPLGRLRPVYVVSALVPLATLWALIVSRPEFRLYSAMACAIVFMLVQWFFPKCRLRTDHYLSPINVALLLFALKLVVNPILIMADKPSLGTLPQLPSRASMEGAMLVELVAFLGFALALQFVPERLSRRPAVLNLLDRTPGRLVPLAYCLIGIVGLYEAFHSVSLFIEYFQNPAAVEKMRETAEGTFSGLFGTLLRPFLAFSLVIFWSRQVDLRERGGLTPSILFITALVTLGIAIANLTFAFNRAAFVFPLISLAAVFMLRVKRISPVLVLGAAAIVLPALAAVATFRTGKQDVSEFVQDDSKPQHAEGLSTQIQIYGSAPQFLAFFLDYVEWGKSPAWGRTLLASAMTPVPVLGKPFRDHNGVSLFNRAIYGVEGIEDQILPFQGEVFYNFHIVGVAGIYFLLGLFMGRMQLYFEAVETTAAAFSIHYMSLWSSMLIMWSTAILSQITVYFFWPIYSLVLMALAHNWAGRAYMSRMVREQAVRPHRLRHGAV